MADISKITLPDNSSYDIKDATARSKLDYTNVAYCTCNTAAATVEKVVTVVGNDKWQLKPGAIIMVLGTNTNTANASKLNVNGTGAKSIVYEGSVVTNALWSVTANRIMTYVYDGTNYRYVTRSIDSDNVDRIRASGGIKINATTSTLDREILVAKDGLYYPLRTGIAFDITSPILISGGSLAVNSFSTWCYLVWTAYALRTQDITLTSYKPVYIKGKLSGITFTPINTTPLSQTIPTSDDGYQYMLIGDACADNKFIQVYLEHPIFEYKNGKFRLVGADDEVTVDTALSDTSTNPVQNKVVNAAIEACNDLANSMYKGFAVTPSTISSDPGASAPYTVYTTINTINLRRGDNTNDTQTIKSTYYEYRDAAYTRAGLMPSGHYTFIEKYKKIRGSSASYTFTSMQGYITVTNCYGNCNNGLVVLSGWFTSTGSAGNPAIISGSFPSAASSFVCGIIVNIDSPNTNTRLLVRHEDDGTSSLQCGGSLTAGKYFFIGVYTAERCTYNLPYTL